jgi:hypothetical protein
LHSPLVVQFPIMPLSVGELGLERRVIPSFIPPPDGTQRIHNASHKLTEARNTMMKAHRRLNDFLERGTVPEDLKRSE